MLFLKLLKFTWNIIVHRFNRAVYYISRRFNLNETEI